MVDGINNVPGSGVPSLSSIKRNTEVSSESSSSNSQGARAQKVSRIEKDAVVVEVSERSRSASEVEVTVAEVNQSAAGSEAPTTQELTLALNADTVAAALGNTVDISV